jgi:hypothetical protein
MLVYFLNEEFGWFTLQNPPLLMCNKYNLSQTFVCFVPNFAKENPGMKIIDLLP